MAHQNSKVQQLNTSIISSIDGIGNLLNNTVQQLNTSVNQNTDQLGIAFRAFHSVHLVSCAALPPSFPSGYYWVRASNGSAVHVYCDMTRSCGGVTGGWRRVAELDMTNSTNVPVVSNSALTPTSGRVGSLLRDASRSPSPLPHWSIPKCVEKSRHTSMGFLMHLEVVMWMVLVSLMETQDSTSGHLWQHDYDEVSSHPAYNCPCTNINTASQASPPPAFVGNDYFCDTGSSGTAMQRVFYGDDPLWDGAGCGPLNTCCSFNNPPLIVLQAVATAYH